GGHPPVRARLEPLGALDRGRREQRDPQPTLGGEGLLRGEVVGVRLGYVHCHSAGRRGGVDQHQLIGSGALRPTDRRHHAGRGLVVRPGVDIDAFATHRCGQAPGLGAHDVRLGEMGSGRGLGGELLRELPEHQVLGARADQAERRDVPERGGATIAQDHLVSLGQGEHLGQAGADARDQLLDRGLTVGGPHDGATESGQHLHLRIPDARGARPETAVTGQQLGRNGQGADGLGTGGASIGHGLLLRTRPAPEAGYVHPASAPATPSHRSAHVAGIWQDRTMSRADLQKQPYDVAGMFDSIARRYDMMNDVAALGQVRMWREAMVDSLGVDDGDRVLDLPAGTRPSAAAIPRPGARVVAADSSLRLRPEGRRRGAPVPFVAADLSCGLRNVHEPRRALTEMTRVVRPGGRVVVCEFSTPSSPVLRAVYEKYLLRALPAVAGRLATSADGYDYLTESILDWP